MDISAVEELGLERRDVSTAAAACSGSDRRRQRRLANRLNLHRPRKQTRSRDPSTSDQFDPSINRFGCGHVEDMGSGQPVSLTSDYHSEGHDLSLVNGLQDYHPADLQTGVEDSMPSWDASSCRTALSDLSDAAPPAASSESKKQLQRSEVETNDFLSEPCCYSGSERRSTSPSRRRRSVADRGVRKKRASHQEREARRRSLRNTANFCDSRPRRSSSEESAKDVWRGSAGLQRCNIVCGMSMSMSSLQPPPHRTSDTPAPDISSLARQVSSSACGSLRRKRKGCDGLTDSVRGSLESVVNRENFWEALQPSYQFLMDGQLIHDCKEINAELVWDSGDVPELESCPCSMEQLVVQYTDLMQWLNRVQGDLYKSPRTITNTALRQSLSAEMRQKRCERQLFSDRCCHLLTIRPEVRGEWGWRQRHLLQKWDELEAITGVSSPRHQHEMQEHDTVDNCQIHDVRREVRGLERWFQEMDHRLGKISFRLHFNCIEDLADCMSYHQALHVEIQSHQVIVSSVRALCSEVSTQDASFQSLADQLELHWQQLYLRAYEWIYHLETYQNQQQVELPSREQTCCWSEEFQQTDEPLCKIARLDSDDQHLVRPASASEDCSDAGSFFEDDYLLCHTAMNVPSVVEGSSSDMYSPRPAHSLRDKGYSSENSSAGSSDSSAEPAAAAGLLKLLDAAGASSLRRATVNTSNVRCETVATADCVSDEACGEEAPMCSARRRELAVTSTPRSYSVSERPADNCGTFYFRHESDIEEGNSVSALPSPPAQTAATLQSAAPPADLVSSRISSCDEVEDIEEDLAEVAYMDQRDTEDSSVLADDADIQQLVEQAESLVRCGNLAAGLQVLPAGHSGASRSFRDRHVRNWVAKQRTPRRTETSAMECQVADNSCDASCESVGSESDRDSSSLTASDEDLSSSMVTCHEVTLVTSSTAAANHSVDAQTPTKVLLRGNKKRRAGQRPWSLHVVTADVRRAAGRSSLSVSETALHQVAAPSSATAVCGGGEKLAVTSSSSTTTLSAGAAPRRLPPSLVDSWCNARRSARRGLRRSAPLSSGSECADGGVSLGGSPPSLAANRRRRRSSWRPIDQQAICCQVVKSRSFTGTANLPDSSQLRVDIDGSTVDTDHSPVCTGSHDNADESEPATPSAVDVINTVEISSVSEQAWDPYQEYKPIPELGSEASLDVDTVRQLLDCDDYRNFIDSEDGGGSSQVSAGQMAAPVRRPPPARRQRRKVRLLGSDSADSDHPSVLQILLESADCLRLLENRMQESDTSASYVEVVRVCDDELAQLEDVVTWFDPTAGGRDPVTQRTGLLTELHGVISRWRALRLEAMDRQRHVDPGQLQRRISALGQQLASIDSCSCSTDPESIEQLQTRIHLSQELESRLSRLRGELGDINADVHRHVVLSSPTSDDALKHDVAALYKLLDQISTRLSGQLERLVVLDATWREFLEAGEQLKIALASDRAAMCAVRQAALSGRQLTDEVTRVAQLLNPVAAADGVTQGQQQVTSNSRIRGMLGSRDDVSSGYDSASSEEHSERVRRLGRMSRAAGRLQLLLQPTSAAWTGVQHTMTAATSELRDLQATCRDLVIQTTLPVEETPCCRPVQRALGGGGAGWPFCRLGRVLRASLPFQLALILCLCAAYLLEPTCCDNVNAFSMSMIPQLRYVSGPPPI